MIVVPQERIQDFKAKGWWGDTTLDDLFLKHVRERPDDEACVDPVNAAAIVGGVGDRLT